MLAFFTDGLEIWDNESHQVGAHLHRRVKVILQQPVGEFYSSQLLEELTLH